MKNLLGVLLLFVFASAQAALIDNSTYISDTDTGLDWLTLAPTLDRSYNDVSSKFGVGQEFEGWRYASGSEFDQLMFDAGIVADNDLVDFFGDPANTTTCDPGVGFCGNIRDLHDAVTVNGGVAEMTAVSDLLGNLAPYPPPTFLFDVFYTVGILSDIDSGNIDPTAHFIASLVFGGAVNGSINTFDSGFAPGDTHEALGSYLVRTSTVPVPAAVWLFGSALGLLGWMRRKTT